MAKHGMRIGGGMDKIGAHLAHHEAAMVESLLAHAAWDIADHEEHCCSCHSPTCEQKLRFMKEAQLALLERAEELHKETGRGWN